MHLVPAVVAKNLNDVVENNMILIFKRIPTSTQKSDIIKHISPEIKGKFFQKSGYIESIQFISFKDEIKSLAEHHALITVEPDSAAERVIKKLNRKPFLGKHIAIQEYHIRSWHNDRRENFNNEANELLGQQKRSDRRRHHLKAIKKEKITYSK